MKKILAVIMCGGKGTRMKKYYNIEKPLLKIKNKRIIEYVIETLVKSNSFYKIVACTSNNSINTEKFLEINYNKYKKPIKVVRTEGLGYSQDLAYIIRRYSKNIVFVVSSDLPLLEVLDITTILERCKFKRWHNSVIINKKFVEKLGIKPSITLKYYKRDYCYAGIEIFSKDACKNLRDDGLTNVRYIVINRTGIAVNINEKQDLDLARKMSGVCGL